MNANLVDRIYECCFVPELWPGVLDEVADIAGGQGGFLFAARDTLLNWTASEPLKPVFQNYVEDGWFARCTRRIGLFGRASPGFLVEHDYWTAEEIENNPVYRDFFRPRGLGWSASTILRMPAGDNIVFSLERKFSEGPVEPTSVERLDALRPHIARSAFVSARLDLQRAKGASATLAMMGLPALVLDEDGVVIEANGLMLSLGQQVQWRAFDRIALLDKQANELLWSSMAAMGTETGGEVRSFALRGGARRTAHIVHVLPIRHSAQDIFARSHALMVMTPVAAPKAPAVELIRSLFDLTVAEARVARGLAVGETLYEIAGAGEVALSTVRSQLRQVMQKTGCTRQAEVVGLLANVALDRGVVD